ncbi:transcription factor Sox-19a-like isoform X2 [Notolabrus celidotus]|uniref:transcription factor Sox-19a-like isoform X2 n=1 Tax=Notolabrus celidotus TaxID=1203425 RepID=UPI00149070E4|nr:transcription factor Sox-19a-like isoform X2 [Notolabrus celidotus]
MEGLSESWRPGPGSSSTGTGQGGQDLNKAAIQCFQAGDVDQIQPLVPPLENYWAPMGARCGYGDGNLPPISTFGNKYLPDQHVSVGLRGSDCNGVGTRSETVPSDPQQVGPGHGPGTAGEDPIRVTEGASLQPAFTDLMLLQSYQSKSGHIKRPMNAFLVWSNIQRCTLKEQNPGENLNYTSSYLGNEWSKLSQEEKRPYFEIAQKLKRIHQKRFPDYEYRPQRKRKCLSPSPGGGQDTTPTRTHTSSPPQSEFQGAGMNAWPTMMPYIAGHYHCPSFYQCIPLDLYSRSDVQSARTFNRHPNTCSAMMQEVNYGNSQQRDERNQALLYNEQQEHYTSDNYYKCMTGSGTTPHNLEPTGVSTSQQLSANDAVGFKSDDFVDVVGLL